MPPLAANAEVREAPMPPVELPVTTTTGGGVMGCRDSSFGSRILRVERLLIAVGNGSVKSVKSRTAPNHNCFVDATEAGRRRRAAIPESTAKLILFRCALCRSLLRGNYVKPALPIMCSLFSHVP